MTVSLSLSIDTKALAESFEAAGERYQAALKTALNMAASFIQTETLADIRSAGKFGASYTQGLKVTVDNMSINTMLNGKGAALFETGGVVQGNPLLWLPLSGTDAEGTRAADYPGGLFSVKRPSGVPLLFSISDRKPKYFGIASVTVPKKFHIEEIQLAAMANFKDYFAQALKEAT